MQSMVFSCKCCGGTLPQPKRGQTVVTCEYCDVTQSIAAPDDNRKVELLSRADKLRRDCEFDLASSRFAAIADEFPEESEAYWGLVLCKYGIEYVDDPKTGKKIPTCHRSNYERIQDDNNYKLALQHSQDEEQKALYMQDAAAFDELSRKIIAVSKKQKPYDIFICYKETDERGRRTEDSVVAQDIYDNLTRAGYRVFFSRISLKENALGDEYEPVIFAALHSAKIMLAVGTSTQYYEAVWVRNEWSRYLELINKGESKVLITCYKYLNPGTDLPKELSRREGIDMSQIGAMQDLLRGIGQTIRPAQAQNSGPAARVAEGPDHSLQGMLNKCDTYMKLGNMKAAAETYRMITQEYPEHYEGWWGLIQCRTKNFTIALKDTAEINEWYGYVRQTAGNDEFPDLRKTYLRYLKALSSTLDVPEEMNRVAGIKEKIQEEWNQKLKNLSAENKKIEQAKAALPAAKNEYQKLKKEDKRANDPSARAARHSKKILKQLVTLLIFCAVAVGLIMLRQVFTTGALSESSVPQIPEQTGILGVLVMILNVIIYLVLGLGLYIGLPIIAAVCVLVGIVKFFKSFKTDTSEANRIRQQLEEAESRYEACRRTAEQEILNEEEVNEKYRSLLDHITQYQNLPKDTISTLLTVERCKAVGEKIVYDKNAEALRRETFG